MALPAPRRSGGKDLLSAELIAERTFPLARRGYERDDVQEFLRQVADAVTALYSRLDDADEALREAQERAEHPDISEDVLMARVGEETAGILRSARAASADMQKRAGDEAARLVDEAHQQAGGIRTEAEAVMARSVEEANRSAEEIRAGAQQAADQMLERAKQEVESLRQMAEQERKLTVEGAQAVRDKILADLTRRRRVATVQIEQLRAGRERLLESYALVRSTLQEINDDLQRADAEARAAADEAGKVWEVAELPELPPDLVTSLQGPAEAPVAVVEEIVVEEATAAVDVAELLDEAQAEESPPAEPEAEASTSDAVEPPASEEAEAPAADEAEAPVSDEAEAAAADEAEALASDEAETAGDASEEVAAPEEVAAEPVQDAAPEDEAKVEEPVAVEAKEPEDEPISAAAEERGRAATKSGSARTRTKSRRRPSSPPTPGPDRQGPSPAGDAGDTAKGTTPKAEPAVATAATATARVDEEDAAGGIFDRIRAGRQEAVQAARRTLNGDEEDAEPDAAADDPTESTSTGPAAPGSTAHPVEEEHSEVVRSDVDETLLERRDQVLGELEVILTRKLKRALQDEQNDLLDKMRNGKGEPQLETLLGTEPDQQRRYRDAALPQLELAAREGARFAADVISEQGGKTAPKRAPKVDELADELASELSGHIRRRVEAAIGTGRGDDQAVLVEALSAAYREIKTQRVESSAGDTAGGAFNRGIWETVGDRIPLRWVVEDVDGPCADCDDNALAGGIPRHEGFPTGQAHPPAHAGCRCLLVPDPS